MILTIVRDNQRMLQSLVNQSPHAVQQQLEEEEKKTSSLSKMIKECIEENDRVLCSECIDDIVMCRDGETAEGACPAQEQ